MSKSATKKHQMKVSSKGQRESLAARIVTGGAQFARTLKYISVLTQSVAGQVANVWGDGVGGTTPQPEYCSSWSGLANLWQEYRVRSIKITVHPHLASPTGTTNLLFPVEVVSFIDRSGLLTPGLVQGATDNQAIDQEASKMTTLFSTEPSHLHVHQMHAVDSEDYTWIPTQSVTADRMRLCLLCNSTGVVSNLPILVEFRVEFKGRANSGLVELSRQLTPGTPMAEDCEATACICGRASCDLCVARVRTQVSVPAVPQSGRLLSFDSSRAGANNVRLGVPSSAMCSAPSGSK